MVLFKNKKVPSQAQMVRFMRKQSLVTTVVKYHKKGFPEHLDPVPKCLCQRVIDLEVVVEAMAYKITQLEAELAKKPETKLEA